MSGVLWSKFFWSDWQSDPALRLCSYAARGLWMDMLCIAASHDPIGYVAVSGRGLDSTSLARMTGGEESEVARLIGELDRNGVCSRDRQGRIYSRRMVLDAKKAAQARENGKLGGNPKLGNRSRKRASDNPQPNPQVKAGDKPHKPEASRRVEPINGSNPSTQRLAANEPEGSPPSLRWSGPADIREISVATMGEDWTRSYLDRCAWQDVPERMIQAPTGLIADKLWRALRRQLIDREISIGRKAA